MPETLLVGVLGTGAIFENKSIHEIEKARITEEGDEIDSQTS